MIRIRKRETPPPILLERGREETDRLRAAYDADQAYRDGKETFDFKHAIYGHPSVKDALRQDQHGKCAFCESLFAHVAYGDVEHFRPKAGFVQQDESLQRPGYYWLAYEWANLYFSCQLCNQRFKKNLFPLRDPTQRARSHHGDLTREEPLLLDPGSTDPTAHIGFREEVAFAINGDPAGQVTIDALGLNRPELLEMRRRRLDLRWTPLFGQKPGDPSLHLVRPS